MEWKALGIIAWLMIGCYPQHGMAQHVVQSITAFQYSDYQLDQGLPPSWVSTSSYDRKGHCTTNTYATQMGEQFEYDDKGRLIAKIYLDSFPDGTSNHRVEEQRAYDRRGRLHSIDLCNFILRRHRTQFVYSAKGKLIERILRDDSGQIYSTFQYDYDSCGRLRTCCLYSPQDSLLTLFAAYFYNEAGQCVEHQQPTINGKIITYQDSDCKVPLREQSAVTGEGFDENGYFQSKTWEYDDEGKVVRQVDYGEAGEVLADSNYTYDRWGRIKTKESIRYHPPWRNVTFRTVNDAAGRAVLEEILPAPIPNSADPEDNFIDFEANTATTRRYDALGRCTEVVRKQEGKGLQSYARFEYDDQGRLHRKVSWKLNSTTATQEPGKKTALDTVFHEYAYYGDDSIHAVYRLGKVQEWGPWITVSDENPISRQYHPANGWLAMQEDLNWQIETDSTRISKDTLYEKFSYSQYGRGRVQCQTWKLPRGYLHIVEHDSNGLLLADLWEPGFGYTSKSIDTLYRYQKLGDSLITYRHNPTYYDQIYDMKYWVDGRLVKEDLRSPKMVRKFQHSPAGQLIQVEEVGIDDPWGFIEEDEYTYHLEKFVTTYSYDSQGRRTAMRRYDHNGELKEVLTYRYPTDRESIATYEPYQVRKKTLHETKYWK